MAVDSSGIFATLADLAESTNSDGNWPQESLDHCGKAGVFAWFIPKEYRGTGRSAAEITEGYLGLSAACLTTAFVITQQTAASDRIAQCPNRSIAERLLAGIATGALRATVGISHLTTSRQHVTRPVMQARVVPGGFTVTGYSPWVTGGAHVDWMVMGATLDDKRQILFAVERTAKGVEVKPHARLLGLTGSCTGPVELYEVFVPDGDLLAGPAIDVMSSGTGGGRTGGLSTSTLALGLASQAIRWLVQQSSSRTSLIESATSLDAQWKHARDQLMRAAAGDTTVDTGALRALANSLVIQSTNAAMLTAKGAGYVQGHPAERWCRQALFFLVWSCPQNVQQAHLEQFAICGHPLSDMQ